jgi:hypothetical protein
LDKLGMPDPVAQAMWQQSAFGQKGVGDPGAAVRAEKRGVPRTGAAATPADIAKRKPPQVTKVAPGVSGVEPELKPYFDMIGDVMGKMDVAKTGLEKAALEKTFENLKKILNPGTAAKDRAALMAKVDKSMAKATERSEAAAKAPVGGPVGTNIVAETGAKTFEPLAPAVDIDAALDRVKELEGSIRTFAGGPQLLKTFNGTMGKDLDAPSRAAELLTIQKFLSEHPQAGKTLVEPKEKPDF